jgi:multidrug resistance efflux pump
MNATAEMPFPRFRNDLSIEEKEAGLLGKVFSVYDPLSGERFEFDERTFFLCESFDGLTPPEQIARNFRACFDSTISVRDLLQVFNELLAIGLLTGTDSASIAAFRGHTDNPIARAMPPGAAAGASAAPDEDDGRDGPKEYRWPLFDPGTLFGFLNGALTPLRFLFLLLVYSLVVTLPVALFLFFDNQLLLSQDMARLGDARSYFGRLVFTLFSISLVRCIIQGTVITHFGGRVKAFGILLRFGIIPRFYIDKSAIRRFDRHAKLWSFGSNLLFRMVFIVIGVFTWYFVRGTGSELAIHAIVITQVSMITLILLCLPVRASDGYRWLVTFFRLPSNLIKLALMALTSALTGRQLPTSITPSYKRRLLLYALALILFWAYAFVRITSHITEGLASSFPFVFGEATEIIIATAVVLLVGRWALTTFGRLQGGSSPRAPAQGSVPAIAELEDLALVPAGRVPSATQGESPWIRRGVQLLALGTLALFLSLPQPFRPGGSVTLLPPEQQAIQAPVSGQVTKVLQSGGDGRLLPKGTVIAIMTSSTLETAIKTLQEQVSQQEAVLEKHKAILAELLAGTRQEEIDQARALAEQADHEVALAERELETARVTWRYSAQELDRISKLPAGVISDLEISRSEKQAEVDRMRISEFESSLAAKQKRAEEAVAALSLLINGASQQELEVARQDVAVAEAQLRRVQAELAHARSEANSGRLTIPFDGYLVDAYLDQKLGSYLSQGETFATAQTHQKPMVELLLPEYDVGEMAIGAETEVRLTAFPQQPLTGSVISIEPSGEPADFGQVFKVVIALGDIPYPVKPGMTGYAKVVVGEKPLYIIISRPIVRFFQIEAWSWLP